jgi:predicted HTH transcriptional regulator
MNPENNRIEYKQQLTNDLEKEATAFLNYHEGGVMYIGIDKTAKPIGISDLNLVEHLGSGVPRILRSYGKECFKTIPDKPNSRLQKYRLTIRGKQLKENL